MKTANGALLPLVLALSACGQNDGHNVSANQVPTAANVAANPAPQPTDSAAAPAPTTNDPAGQSAATSIPAALHGRWGLKPADCTRGAGLGRVEITADQVRFYESIAKPAKIIARTDSQIRGEFDFVGEGGTWTNHMIWSVAGDKLTRVDSEEDSRLVYTRC